MYIYMYIYIYIYLTAKGLPIWSVFLCIIVVLYFEIFSNFLKAIS